MPDNNSVHINKCLLPFSWLYGFFVYMRNKLFEWNVLKQKKYNIPVICVGNITVGGTGKTPHVEYLVRLLKDKYKVAVLSRGYKRKTKGFLLATEGVTAVQIGDEPYQIWHKYKNILVAVDGNRRRGIETLQNLSEDKKPEIILLDDAFQHRYVKPSLSILLIDFHRLITEDRLLPAGRLREPAYHVEKANIIIVTKCPDGINPLEQRIIANDIGAYPYQDLFYTAFRYGKIVPLFGEKADAISLTNLNNKSVLLVTGIVNPSPLRNVIKKHSSKVIDIEYSDHHQFSKKDILEIKSVFDGIDSSNKILIVTEKDAARLISLKFMDEDFKKNIYYLPIQVDFINKEDQTIFNTKILKHVRANS